MDDWPFSISRAGRAISGSGVALLSQKSSRPTLQNMMQNITSADGRAQRSFGISLSAFLATLTTSTGVLIFAIVIFAILVMHQSFDVVYKPRSKQLKQRQVNFFSNSFWSWACSVYSASEDDLLRSSGLEAVLFLRYLRFLMWMFAIPSTVLSPIIIGMSTSSGANGNATGLDQLGWPNIKPAQIGRLWGYTGCIVVFVVFVLALVGRQLAELNTTRQAYLNSELSNKSYTVLVSNIPPSLCNTVSLKGFYSRWSDRANDIYIVRDLRILRRRLHNRDRLHRQLESREIDFLYQKMQGGGGAADTPVIRPRREPGLLPHPSSTWTDRKFDDLHHLRQRVADENDEIRRLQHRCQEDENLKQSSAIFQFQDACSAHSMSIALASSKPGCMNHRYLGGSPRDIIYENLGIKGAQAEVRRFLSWFICLGLIILWAFPIGMTGALSQLDALARLVSLSDMIDSWPSWIVATLQGVLPSAATSLLMLMFPYLLRRLVQQQMLPTKMAVELTVQRLYFVFLFVHLCITVSISSGLISFLAHFANNASGVPALLAQNLPKASNYFLRWILMQAFLFSASALLQVNATVQWFIRRRRQGSPRDQVEFCRGREDFLCGTVYPVYTTIGCIVIIYSLLSPLILPLATVAFTMFWFFHRYLLLYVSQPGSETAGKATFQAIFQLFTGLYVLQLCFIGLFLLNLGSLRLAHRVCQTLVLVALLASTILYHIHLRLTYEPLFEQTALDHARGDPLKAKRNKGRNERGGEPAVLAASHDECGTTDTPHGRVRDPALDAPIPVVWIPQDDLGHSQNQKRLYGSDYPCVLLPITDSGAHIEESGRVILTCEGTTLPEESKIEWRAIV